MQPAARAETGWVPDHQQDPARRRMGRGARARCSGACTAAGPEEQPPAGAARESHACAAFCGHWSSVSCVRRTMQCAGCAATGAHLRPWREALEQCARPVVRPMRGGRAATSASVLGASRGRCAPASLAALRGGAPTPPVCRLASRQMQARCRAPALAPAGGLGGWAPLLLMLQRCDRAWAPRRRCARVSRALALCRLAWPAGAALPSLVAVTSAPRGSRLLARQGMLTRRSRRPARSARKPVWHGTERPSSVHRSVCSCSGAGRLGAGEGQRCAAVAVHGVSGAGSRFARGHAAASCPARPNHDETQGAGRTSGRALSGLCCACARWRQHVSGIEPCCLPSVMGEDLRATDDEWLCSHALVRVICAIELPANPCRREQGWGVPRRNQME